MNISPAVNQYIKTIEQRAQEFYKKTKSTRFVPPAVTDSLVQERLMRIGVEVKYTGAQTMDEFYMIALATLHEDYINHHEGNQLVAIRNVFDFNYIFAEQLKHDTDRLYFMSRINGKCEVLALKLNEHEHVINKYTYAEIGSTGMPTLY